MTTSTSPQEPHPSAAKQTLKLHDPGELLAAIPALLGFVPEDSLVILCLGGESDNGIEMVVRHDLVSLVAEPERMLALASQLRTLFDETAVGSVSFVVIDSDWAGDEASEWHRELVADMGSLLIAGGAQIKGALLASKIGCGDSWASLLDSRAGAIPDPMESAVAAAHVFQGRMIRGSRTELASTIAPALAGELETMRSLIDDLCGEVRRRREMGGPSALRRELEMVLSAVAASESGEAAEGREVAMLAMAISAPLVRDALLALVIGDHADGAERLWGLMSRLLPAPERAESLALCAVSAYARGDGPFAGICVEAALDADPEHRLASLLREALDQGMHPDRIRQLAEIGRECAADLGVFLPAP